MSDVSKHYYVEDQIFKIYAALIDEFPGGTQMLGTIIINRIIKEAVKIGFVKYAEPARLDMFDEYKQMAEYLKDKWCLVYNAMETGAEYSDGFILTASSTKEAKRIFESSNYVKTRGFGGGNGKAIAYCDYMTCVKSFKPDPDLIFKPTPYLQITWLDLDEDRALKIEKEHRAFEKDPKGEIARIMKQVNDTFSGMIPPSEIP